MKDIKRILLLYKSSSYQVYFHDTTQFPRHVKKSSRDIRRFRETHERHFRALAKIEKLLRQKGLAYHKAGRGSRVKFSSYDLILTVGGDGTFLEGARQITSQLILGINSDPKWSVGQFCAAAARDFGKVLDRLLQGKLKIKPLSRIHLRIRGFKKNVVALNDILVCHHNPAAMSRYHLSLEGVREEQKSSGVWVATAAGSTGAIRSAGGRVLPVTSRSLQYMPRELYRGNGPRHRLKGGLVKDGRSLRVTSLMKDGVVYIDGCHVSFPFHFGEELLIRRAKNPLRVVSL